MKRAMKSSCHRIIPKLHMVSALLHFISVAPELLLALQDMPRQQLLLPPMQHLQLLVQLHQVSSSAIHL